jgi:hypothetical protein
MRLNPLSSNLMSEADRAVQHFLELGVTIEVEHIALVPVKNMFIPRLRGLMVAMIASSLATATPTMAELIPGEKILLGATGTAQSIDVRGYAKGTVALFKTLGDRDSGQQRCMGYGSLEPDHIMEIQPKASEVILQVKTRSQDTTLVVEGPNNKLYCADDSSKGGKDAGLTLKAPKAGTYRVWVGTFEPGAGVRYLLSVQSK